MKRHLKFFGAVIAFFALEAILVGFIDRPLSLTLRAIDAHNPDLINFFRAYTDYGKSVWYLWPSGIGIISCVLALRFKSLLPSQRERLSALGEQFVFFFLSIALSGILTDIVKPIIGRARPALLDRDGIYGAHPFSFHALWNSMPSGHATTAFTLIFVMTGLAPRMRALWWGLGLTLAVSRIMVNAHYVSDVLAGGAVAYMTTLLVKVWLDRYGSEFLKRHVFRRGESPI